MIARRSRSPLQHRPARCASLGHQIGQHSGKLAVAPLPEAGDGIEGAPMNAHLTTI
jgi:hypothetical protein